MKRWTPAGGEHQVPFMAAASRASRGELGRCPKCGRADLRSYFHAFKPELRQGTIWCWCPACNTYTHLPRISPTGAVPKDPFSSLSLAQFSDLERDPAEPWLDRLDCLWDDGTLSIAASPTR